MDGSTLKQGVRTDARAWWLIVAALVVLMEVIAACSGGDASWDLRNYHLYGPFALLHKPTGTDVAPAHLQTFLSPTLDLFYYALARTIGPTALLNAVLAIPQAAAAAMAFALACRVVRPVGRAELLAVGVLTAVAATGTAALSTIALSMSEILPVACVLGAWLVLVAPDGVRVPSVGRCGVAGLLVGAACGLKLTLSFATVGLFLCLWLLPWRRVTEWAGRPIAFGVGVGLGTAALSGYWWLHQWQLYGNPVFPMMNGLFRSPMAAPESFVDPTFLPHGWVDALSAPWSWALRLSWATGESRLRDPRFALAMLAALGLLVRAVVRWRRLPWPLLVLPAWFVLSFALWRFEFSIGRYLAVLELFTGLLLAAALVPLARRWRQPGAALGGSLLVAAACAVLTVYPRLHRTAPGFGPAMAVSLGDVPADGTVLLLDNEPLAYLAAFADPRTRFVGTNDFFMSLDGHNPMQPEVARAIETAGPLFGLEAPEAEPGRADATLTHYRLARETCRPLETNLSPDPIRLCRLSRTPAG